MNFSVTISTRIMLAMTLLLLCTTSVSASSIYILDDLDSNRNIPYSNTSGGSATIGDFITSDGDSEMRAIADNAANFNQYGNFNFSSSASNRAGAAVDSLVNGSAIEIDLFSLDADLTGNVKVRLVLNSNAWLDGGSGYRTFGSSAEETLNDGSDDTELLELDYSNRQNVKDLFANWKAGNGTFLQIFLDNDGAGNSDGQNTFYFDDVRVTGVIPEPTSLALAFVGMIALCGVSRRQS